MEQITFEMLAQFIDPKLLVLVPILWGMGNWLKAIPTMPDWVIPFYLMALSISLAVLYMLVFHTSNLQAIWLGIMQGLAIAVFQGYSHAIYKQLSKKGGR